MSLFKEYQDNFKKIVKLYDLYICRSLYVDNCPGLYVELYGHSDGSLREVTESKLLALFNPSP